ncbi:MAG: LPS assembly protein LptD [Gammaproteobacteria bacterium]|nr:LPS assembly protein LptD [Gammaproteobacteria bacterium]
MQFRKSLLYSNISLIISAGVLMCQPGAQVFAQTPAQNQNQGQWTCSANANGNWQCIENPVAARTTTTTGVVVTSGGGERTISQGSQRTQGGAGIRNVTNQPTALDWVTSDQMTAEQRATVPANCCGAFVEPARQGLDGQPVDPEADPNTSPTLFTAPGGIDQTSGSASVININGDVFIQQGNRTVQNTTATVIDRDADTITLNGNVTFREPGVVMTGNSAFIDQANRSNRLENANYVLHQYGVHGAASVVIYDSGGEVLAIENGEFSRCEPGNEFWILQARSMTLDTGAGIGTATAVTLRIKDVPIFHYPFTVPFPLGDQRVSGFLAPSIGSTSDGGLDIEMPYYFNLAPHYDATLTPRFIADRGVMAAAEVRYLASWSMNTVNVAALPNDRRYNVATASVPGSNSPSVEKRWFMGFEHDGALGENWTTQINYESVSDDDYFHDLGSSGLNISSRTHLQRTGALNYRSGNWYGGTRVQRIDIIDPFISASDLNIPYDRLPELTLGTKYSLGPLEIGFDASHVRFDRSLEDSLLTQSQLDNGALVTGARANVEPHISLPIRGAAGFFVPTAKYKYTTWELEQQADGTDDNPDRGIGVFNLDTGLIFERPLSGGFIQTLEPRLYYLYSQQKDQSLLPTFDSAQLNFSFAQLFRDNRFSGLDRIGDADQLSVAMGSRFINSRGEEKARVSVGQIHYFTDRIVSLDSLLQSWVTLQARNTERSALAGEAMYQFNDRWRMDTDLQWNQDLHRADEGSFALRYQSDENHIFNIGYRYRLLVDLYGPPPPGIDPRIKQTDISGIWPLNNNWRLLGRWHYDHSNSRNLDTFAGVEYSNCCATIRLVGREWVDDDEFFLLRNESNTGVFFQLTLNGLGDISGGGISRLLSDGILGFREYGENE